MFSFQQTRGSIEVAFTDRHGGFSDGPYASLNLAAPADDLSEQEAVDENLDVVAYAMARGGEATGENPFELPAGVRVPTLVAMRQVHGAHVHTVDRAWLRDRHAVPAEADGLVTQVPGVILLVRVADCVPVLLADLDRGVVAAAHAGRVGLAAGIVAATVTGMRRLGAEHLVAWVGPRVCGRCYEVPADMREEVSAVVPEACAETSWGTPALDVGAGVVAQLGANGVEVVDVPRCTVEDEDLYSYRRQGAASGRFGGLVWVRP